MKSDEPAELPACPWCGATWTAAMLELFARHAHGDSCSCCAVVLPGLGPDPARVAKPDRDLSCEKCGKPIYRAPAELNTAGLH